MKLSRNWLIFHCTLSLFWIATDSHAALPPLLKEVEAKYAKSPTLQAEFTQVNEVAALKTKKVSSGVFMVKRPNKLRWETLKPDTSLLVSDGSTFWFYTPPFEEGDRGQLIVRKSAEMTSRLTNSLLSGRFSVAKEMKIQQVSETSFTLTPKKGKAGTIERALIEIEPQLKLIQKVILEHRGGNRAEISLANIEFNKDLRDQTFQFSAPPNTDTVNP
jgi:outer membrane lipoprotein carrier protein